MTDRRREAEDLRRRMAEADVEILRAFEKRAELARELGKVRPAGPPSLPSNEREQIEALERAAAEDLPPGVVRAIFREVHAGTLPFESPVRAAYAGPDGGFRYVAARKQ